MKLWKLITVKIMVYGIPAIPSYVTWLVGKPLIASVPTNVIGMFILAILMYITAFFINMYTFENSYEEFLRN